MASDILAHPGMAYATPLPKVLLVDEEEGDLRMIRLILEGQELDVFTCKSYAAGIQCLERETFDFVVVSQGTQAFEGRAVVDRALQLNRHRPVLVVTRCMTMNCYLEAMQMGAIDYVEKPVPPLDFLRFVQAHASPPAFRSCGTIA